MYDTKQELTTVALQVLKCRFLVISPTILQAILNLWTILKITKRYTVGVRVFEPYNGSRP